MSKRKLKLMSPQQEQTVLALKVWENILQNKTVQSQKFL